MQSEGLALFLLQRSSRGPSSVGHWGSVPGAQRSLLGCVFRLALQPPAVPWRHSPEVSLWCQSQERQPAARWLCRAEAKAAVVWCGTVCAENKGRVCPEGVSLWTRLQCERPLLGPRCLFSSLIRREVFSHMCGKSRFPGLGSHPAVTQLQLIFRSCPGCSRVRAAWASRQGQLSDAPLANHACSSSYFLLLFCSF